MNVIAIRDALAEQLEGFGTLTATGRLPDADGALDLPHAFVSDMSLRFEALGYFDLGEKPPVDVAFEVTIVVAHADADTEEGWDIISRLCSIGDGDSIVEMLLSDRTLNGEVSDITFGEIRGISGSYDIAGGTYLGFQMTFVAHV